MNVVSLKKFLLGATLVYSACASTTAMAAQTWNTWNLGDTSATPAGDGGTTSNGCLRSAGGGYGNTVTCNGTGTVAPIKAELRGWGNGDPNPGSIFVANYLSNQGYNGIGMRDTFESTDAPYHAVDSINNSELVSIKFDKAVSLQNVTLGWSVGDADFSVLAWTGPGAPDLNTTIATRSVNGSTANGSYAATTGLLAAGWTLVGQYGNSGGTSSTADDSDRTVAINKGITANGDSVGGTVFSSSYWLIGAFNSSYATGGSGGLGRDNVSDAWKLLSVAGVATVPEPGSLALVGLALLGAVGARRVRAVSV